MASRCCPEECIQKAGRRCARYLRCGVAAEAEGAGVGERDDRRAVRHQEGESPEHLQAAGHGVAQELARHHCKSLAGSSVASCCSSYRRSQSTALLQSAFAKPNRRLAQSRTANELLVMKTKPGQGCRRLHGRRRRQISPATAASPPGGWSCPRRRNPPSTRPAGNQTPAAGVARSTRARPPD